MNTVDNTALTESQVRALRDKVFGQQSTDKNWDGCKENWMRPSEIKWLQTMAASKKV